MDRYRCVNRYKHGVDCPGWVNVHGARCEDCVVVCDRPDRTRTLLTLDSTTARVEIRGLDMIDERKEGHMGECICSTLLSRINLVHPECAIL
ncbi:hypothetical protein CCHR01_17089 [Colletotrichum chrysophilum]|uniref:Uncharacterized protein n=1 Tax=Colletotrichum chrysophilum TaxID=1836956 RepID=A0AAD9A7B2_9PEZI|nr:hypothetical protein CCHR01_17089 [Colletotrichum chrysophilum]